MEERLNLLVRSSSESLNDSHFITPFSPASLLLAQPPDQSESRRPHDGEIQYHRDKGAECWAKVVEDTVGLFGEDDNDSRYEKSLEVLKFQYVR